MPGYSKTTIQRYFRRADRAATTSEKGKALEDLICYLFGRIPGLSISQRNVMTVFDTEEIDVAFWNEQSPSGLKSFNAFFLVECKNWSKAVGSMEVNWFLSKIESRGLDFGIFVAAEGITGSAKDKTAAHDIVSKALARGTRMILMTREEIEKLTTSKELVSLIKMKVCQLIATGSIWP